MKIDEPKADDGFIAAGHLNRVFGWSLLVIGLVAAALLDPWIFADSVTIEFANSMKPMVRHAQGVVLGMAFLQLAMGTLLATPAFPSAARRTAALLTGGGAAIYTTGYLLGLESSTFRWLVLVGSSLNFAGFAYLMCLSPAGEYAQKIKMMLPIAAFGMLLDFTAGLIFVFPEHSVLSYLGPDDGLRLRMMRLARVAVIALSVITLLYQGLAFRTSSQRLAEPGGWSLICGAIGMPLILAAACFTTVSLKYLLIFPATAVSIGVFVGLWLAIREGALLEQAGWMLIAGSIGFGLLMGLYSFDGPLPTPEFIGDYNELARRLIRLAHSYAIVLGMLSIFLAREMAMVETKRGTSWGTSLFLLGSLTTLGVLVTQTIVPLPTAALYAGPAITVIGIMMCLVHRSTAALTSST